MIGAIVQSGMPQGMMAESLGVSQATVSLLKHKKLRPSTAARYLESLKKLMSDQGLSTQAKVSNTSDVEPIGQFGLWLGEKLQEYQKTPAEIAEHAGVSAVTINYILDGTTSSPQSGTKDKIKAALEKLSNAEATDGAPEEREAQDTFYGLPYNEQEVQQVPNRKGVYAIHDRRGYPTYIGKGNLKARLLDHLKERAFVESKVAYTFSYVVLQKSDSEQAKKRADHESKRLERILTKFAGTTLLLNERNRFDPSESS